MEISLYDAYLFITKASSKNFEIARLQTNNTLNIEIKTFINKKKTKIIKVKFKLNHK